MPPARACTSHAELAYGKWTGNARCGSQQWHCEQCPERCECDLAGQTGRKYSVIPWGVIVRAGW